MPDIIIHLGREIGLTVLDLALLICCPIFAALGTAVSAAIRRATSKPQFEEAAELPVSMQGKSENELPDAEKLKLYNEKRQQGFREYEHYLSRSETHRLAFIGFVLGSDRPLLCRCNYTEHHVTSANSGIVRPLGLPSAEYLESSREGDNKCG